MVEGGSTRNGIKVDVTSGAKAEEGGGRGVPVGERKVGWCVVWCGVEVVGCCVGGSEAPGVWVLGGGCGGRFSKLGGGIRTARSNCELES